jgi:uncharacterized membrane protein
MATTTEQVTFLLTAQDRTAAAMAAASGRLERMEGLYKRVKSAAIVTFGAAVVGGLVAFTRAAMNNVDALSKQSDLLGISINSLMAYERMAQRAGIAPEQFNKNLERMITNLASTSNASGPAARAMERLGLNAQTLARSGTDNALKQIADKMKGVASESEKARIAKELFGKEGIRMVRILGNGSEALDQAREDAERLGLTLNSIDAKQVEAANDAIAEVGNKLRMVGMAFAVTFAPAITVFAEQVVKATGNLTWLRNGMIRFVDLAITGVAAVQKSMLFLEASFLLGQKAILGMAEAFYTLSNFDSSSITDTIKKVAAEIDALRKKFNEDPTAKDWFDDVKKRLTDLPDVVGDGLSSIQFFAKEVQSAVGGVASTLERGLVDAFTTGRMKAREMLQDILKQIMQVVVRTMILRPLMGALGGMMGDTTLGKAFTAYANPGAAIGGPVSAGRPYLVGEHGPEVIVPAGDGNVIPNHKLGGGGGVTYNIDARGASMEAVARLEQALVRINASIEPRAIQANLNWQARSMA